MCLCIEITVRVYCLRVIRRGGDRVCIFCFVGDGKKSALRLVSVYNSSRTSVQCVYNVSASMPPLYCYHLVLLCRSVRGETVMRSLGLTQNANVMLQWVPMIGPHYIMLIVIVNSSDHSGVKKQDVRL